MAVDPLEGIEREQRDAIIGRYLYHLSDDFHLLSRDITCGRSDLTAR